MVKSIGFTLTVAACLQSVAATLTAGVGSFYTSSKKQWIYINPTDSKLYLGGSDLDSPAASEFSIFPGTLTNNWFIQDVKTGLYVTTVAGYSILRATTTTPATYNVFNLTTRASDNTFQMVAWNGDYSKSMYIAADSTTALVPKYKPDQLASAPRFSFQHTTHTVGGVSYRQYSSKTERVTFNVSTTTVSEADGFGYGYNVFWTGNALDKTRAALMYLGGSDSRSNAMDDIDDVYAKGTSTGPPKLLTLNGTDAKAMFDNFLLVTVISPTCYNTSTNTFIGTSCGEEKDNHFLKHYRPWELKKIYDAVLATFTFDTARFAIAGTGMGGRGGLRFLEAHANLTSAVSMVSGALETENSTYIHALPYIPWNSGEGCWDLTQPNVGGECADADVIQPTMADGGKLAGFPIRLWSSHNDDIDTLAEADETCEQVNDAATGNCTVIDTGAATHGDMAYYGRDDQTIKWLHGYKRPKGGVSAWSP